MNEADPVLVRLVGPLRRRAIGAVLVALRAAEMDGGAVVPEPELRDGEGRIARSGPLSLPRRGDLAVTLGGRTLIRRVDGPAAPRGRSIAVVTGGSFVAEIAPFRWDAAEMTVFAKQQQPNWAPLRRWYLEWFQRRHGEAAPDLLGAVHSLDGPLRSGRGWAFTADFGSASVSCLTDLLEALAATGAARLRIGQG